MAVETIYGAFVRGKAEQTPIEMAVPGFSDAGVRNHCEKLTFTAGASVGSKGYLGKFPSNAIFLPQSKFFFGAAGAGATLNIGDSEDEGGLASVVDVSSAGSADVLEAKTAGTRIQRLWEHLGYSEDPGTEIDLYASIAGAAATNSLVVELSIMWTPA
jgi:hypothetical protein